MRTRLTTTMSRHPVVAYAILTYCISWTLVLPLALNGMGVTRLPMPSGWHAVGALGPITAAFIVTAMVDGRNGVRTLLKSMGRWRVGWLWWAIGAGTPILMFVLAVVGVGVSSRHWLDFSQTFATPSSAWFWVVDGVVAAMLYAVGEEPGWRGFALSRLQNRWNAIIATLLVFVAWAIFHFPFFFYRYDFGLGTIVGFLVGLLAGAVWLTYLYNSTGGSVLVVMVWHALFNLANAITIAADPDATAVMSVIAIVLGVVALVIGKPTRLSSERQTPATQPARVASASSGATTGLTW
ncbi:MAG TPA: CPBP family intramembrane glutamic endopeptidase [Ktedonobacterales bacterium]